MKNPRIDNDIANHDNGTRYVSDAKGQVLPESDLSSERSSAQRLFGVFKRSFKEFGSDKVTVYGAALSFFSVFALPPLLVLLVTLLGYVVDGTVVQEQILEQVRLAGGPSRAEVVRTILESGTQSGSSGFFAVVISLGLLFFSASNIFVQLQLTLNAIWNVEPHPDLGLKQTVFVRLTSFGMILSVGFLVVMMLIADLALSVIQSTMGEQLGIFGQLQIFKLASLGISFVLLSAVLAGVFKVLPDVEVRWRDVAVGAVLTALLLSVSKYLISFYLGTSDMGSAYGSAGAMIVFLFWLYLNLLIFLFGAELTESYAREFGSGLRPSEHARWANPAKVNSSSAQET